MDAARHQRGGQRTVGQVAWQGGVESPAVRRCEARHGGVSSADRTAVERRYELRNGVPAGDGWRYELGDLSRENIRAVIQGPAVDDTGSIDRDALTSEGRDIRVTVWHPFSDLFDRPSQLLQLHQSLWLLLAGGVLLRAARASSARCRRNMTVATLLLVGVMTVAFPIDPSFVTMGEWYEHGQGVGFEVYYLGRVRFEKHLSQTILNPLYS